MGIEIMSRGTISAKRTPASKLSATRRSVQKVVATPSPCSMREVSVGLRFAPSWRAQLQMGFVQPQGSSHAP
jgi:hypothetical protein